MNENKKEETLETTETQTETTPEKKVELATNSTFQEGDNLSPPSAPTETEKEVKTEKEVNVKDLTKLNETLTKRIEKLEKKLEPKKEEKPKEKYIPTIQKSQEEKPVEIKGVTKGIYTG